MHFVYSTVDSMQVVDDCVPSVGVGEVPQFPAAVAMSAMIVAANNAATCSCRRRKSGISIRMFAKAMHYLDDMCRGAGRAPHLQVNIVAVLCVQYGAFVAELSHPHSSS
jgi:hypothetical protein